MPAISVSIKLHQTTTSEASECQLKNTFIHILFYFSEYDVKETYIGGHVDTMQPTLGYARSQSYTQLAHQSPDCQQVSHKTIDFVQ